MSRVRHPSPIKHPRPFPSPLLIAPSAPCPSPTTGDTSQAVCLLLRQFDGLKAGYRARRAELQAQALALQAEGGASSDAAAAAEEAVGDMSDWDFLFM